MPVFLSKVKRQTGISAEGAESENEGCQCGRGGSSDRSPALSRMLTLEKGDTAREQLTAASRSANLVREGESAVLRVTRNCQRRTREGAEAGTLAGS